MKKETTRQVRVREANLGDLDRLADIDLALFDNAYGDELPHKSQVVDMLTKRLENNPGWMFVAEMDGVIEGFVTGFRTNTPYENFVSWEHSTADGTLNGKVDPEGRYGYVANMTINHEAVANGGEEMLLANLLANAIRDGLEYAYFVARMPRFKRWLEVQEKGGNGITENNTLQRHAELYLESRNKDGRRYDPQLRMYEGLGFNLKRMVSGAFEDDASMNYGVVFTADVPPNAALKKVKPVRQLMGAGLRLVAKNPRILKKVF